VHIFAFSYPLRNIRRLTTFSLSSRFDDLSQPSMKLCKLRGFLLFASHIFIAWNSPIHFPICLRTIALSLDRLLDPLRASSTSSSTQTSASHNRCMSPLPADMDTYLHYCYIRQYPTNHAYHRYTPSLSLCFTLPNA
jgi:hypothetical protein